MPEPQGSPAGPDPVASTVASYDRLADAYVARWADRHIMADAAERFSRLLRHDSIVVDVGCGPGWDALVLEDYGLFSVGVDLSMGLMQAGREQRGQRFVQADMRHLPFRTGIDGLWVNAALLHLPRADSAAALAGFYRILRPGGVLFLAVKEGKGAGWVKGGHDARARRYFTYWEGSALDSLLEEVGFAIVERWRVAAKPHPWLNRIAQRPPGSRTPARSSTPGWRQR